LLRGAYIERQARAEPEEILAETGAETATRGGAPRLAPLDSLALDLGRRSDLDFGARRLFVQETVRTPRLAVDVEAALSGGGVTLRDGDRLVVPVDLGLVRVYGQVTAPGYLPFREGLDAAAYVEAAGGLAPEATEVYVVDAATGVFASGGPVLPGDAVYAARRPSADSPQVESILIQTQQLAVQREQLELQDRRDRQQARFQLLQTAIQAVGAAVTVILAVEALRR
jgi:hypothetical protein